MLKTVIALLKESSYRSAFFVASRYVRPELLMAALYAVVWVQPDLLGLKTFTGLSWGLWLEFALAHAHTGTSVVAAAFSRNNYYRKIAIGLMSAFYLLFVGAVSIAAGSVLTVILFIVLSVKRVTMPPVPDMGKEILYAFLKVMIFLLTAVLGFGIAQMAPADAGTIEGIEKGAEMVPAWGVCYFIGLYYYEELVVKKFFSAEVKPATV